MEYQPRTVDEEKLLARRLARSLSADEWTPTASHEVGLGADDLRRRSDEIRAALKEWASASSEPSFSSAGTRWLSLALSQSGTPDPARPPSPPGPPMAPSRSARREATGRSGP